MSEPTQPDRDKQVRLQELGQLCKDLFVDRIYLTCNQTHPGMGLEQDAMLFISEVLVRILNEILHQKPESRSDLMDKHRDPKEELPGLFSKSKSKEVKSLNMTFTRLQSIVRDVNPHKLDANATMELMAIFEYVLYLIVNWAGTYVNKMMDDNRTITLPALRTALNADRDLAELVDRLFDESEYPTEGGDSNKDIVPASPQLTKSQETDPNQYEKICRTFCKDEKVFIEDVSTIVNVFKRRLDQGIASDSEGKKIISSIFGNIGEIYELAIKVHRTIDEGMEMTDPPSIGAGFIELAEGMEFEAFVTFAAIFENNVNQETATLIKDPRFKSFFDLEDRAYSSIPTGQTFRMAVKYVLPALLYSVVAHFYTYLKYIKLLYQASLSEIDKEDLYNAEVLLIQVSKQLPALNNVEKQGYRFKRETSYPLGIIPRIQKSIEGWVGKSIGSQCYAFVREGDLQKVRHSPTLADNILRGRSSAERHVFLFDNLLVVTKTLKGNKGITYKYKDQYDIRKADIFDLPDEDDLKNAFRVRASVKGSELKEITLFCHTSEERGDWMTSLIEMQTASILHRMRDAYQKEEEKRIPLMIPTPSEYRYAEPDMDENIVFEDYTHNSGVPVVRSGTILKLIERLTYPHYVDSEFVKTFMTTYRSFCSPTELLNLLIERFSIPVPQVFSHLDQQIVSSPIVASKSGGPLAGRYDTVQSHGWQAYNQVSPANLEQAFHRFREEYQKPIQHKVMQILNHWVRYHSYDFVDPDLTAKMKNFLAGNIVKLSNNHKKWSTKIMDALERKQREADPTTPAAVKDEQKDFAFNQELPEIVWHTAPKGEIGDYDILTLHPLEIGRQVTLLHFHLYRAIKPIELVDAAWTKQDEKYKKSPQLLKLIDHSTKLTYWVAKSIVETESLEERVEIFSRVLEIMCVFEELNNFNGVVAFYSALNCSSVFRLKDSQSKLDKEKQAWYGRFQKLCDPHWKEMLQRLRSINPPCVPFAGTYLSQIFFFKTGRSTYHQPDNDLHADESDSNNRKLVSFMKCRKIAAVIREIQMYQNQPYALRVEPSITQFFENINPLEGFADKDDFETYLYNKSKEIEPREGGCVDSCKPMHSPEALKSPGLKPNKVVSSNFQRSRSHNVHHAHTMPGPFPHKSAPKSTLASPVQKSPPVQLNPDENPFAIVDISPGHQPKWVGDAAGRVNQAFTSEYITQQPHSAGLSSTSSPNGPRSPVSSPLSHSNASRKLPPAPLSAHETRFAFPPVPSSHLNKHPSRPIPNDNNSTFTLCQPPSRRKSDGPAQTLPSRKPPAPSPDSLPFSHSQRDEPGQSTSEEVPALPPRQPGTPHLPHALPADALTQLIEDSRSPSPRSPTVSLMVPLPCSNDIAVAPPRPPKPSSISRTPSSLGMEDEQRAPPLPPKPGLRNDRPAASVLDAPPLPPKPKHAA